MSTLIIYFGLVAAALGMALIRPAYVLGFVLCNFGLQQWTQSQNPYFISNMQLTNYCTGGVLVFALLVKMLKGEPVLSNYPRAGWVALGLYLFSFVSIAWSIYPESAWNNWGVAWRTLVVFMALSPLLISSGDDLRAGLMGTLGFGAVVLTLIMLMAQWSGRMIAWSTVVWVSGKRVEAGNPLAIASMAGYVALAGAMLNFSGAGRFWQMVRWGVVVLAFAVSIRSSSRGQVLAMLLVLMAFVPMSRQIKSFKGFVATCLALMVIVGASYWAYQQFGDTRRFNAEAMYRDYTDARLGTAFTLLSHWFSAGPQAWIMGLGTSASYDPKILGMYPHFVTFEVLGELGVVGFTLWMAVLVMTGRSILRLYRIFNDSPIERGILAAAAALFAFEFILSCKQGNLIGNAYIMTFAIMIGRWELVLRRQAETDLPMEYEGEGEATEMGEPEFTM